MSASNMAEYMQKRRADRRLKLIILLGGVCSHPDCDTTEELEFDHKISAERSFRINGHNLDKPWNLLLEEAAKCQLLCRPHHWMKTIEAGEVKVVDHGGGVSGKRSCQCLPCKTRKAEYMRIFGHPSRVAQLAVATPC